MYVTAPRLLRVTVVSSSAANNRSITSVDKSSGSKDNIETKWGALLFPPSSCCCFSKARRFNARTCFRWPKRSTREIFLTYLLPGPWIFLNVFRPKNAVTIKKQNVPFVSLSISPFVRWRPVLCFFWGWLKTPGLCFCCFAMSKLPNFFQVSFRLPNSSKLKQFSVIRNCV